jgi:hypothetical protein
LENAPIFLDAWRSGLRERGRIEGKNLLVEYRYTQPTASFQSFLGTEFAQPRRGHLAYSLRRNRSGNCEGASGVAPLKTQRRELFAQALARGNTADDAYAEAGFSPNRGNAARLKANEDSTAAGEIDGPAASVIA